MKKPTQEELDLLHGRLCSAIADTTRIAILYELAARPCHVSALVSTLGLPQATVSRHLRVLFDRGLVATQRIGSRVEYRLRDPRVVEALNLMRSVLTDQLKLETETAARIRGKKKTSSPTKGS